ncbi:hypothetical protein RFI_29421 [Reticulomyxa filosa]|uniref:Uncharacterized protein n=1 Tax=Reticulomyxa filosa TaxID=46433 RepID=X6M275_RETFI|nr:hypothetical protein RFI_29421 [Reticulomyxa filosa]|eukprot:ETO07969.1 hypothetical protein RFI_29421 [Reticulomyxa filosa]
MQEFPITTIIQCQSVYLITRMIRANEFGILENIHCMTALEQLNKIIPVQSSTIWILALSDYKGKPIKKKEKKKRIRVRKQEEYANDVERIFQEYCVEFVLKSKKRHFVDFTFVIKCCDNVKCGASDIRNDDDKTQPMSFVNCSIHLIDVVCTQYLGASHIPQFALVCTEELMLCTFVQKEPSVNGLMIQKLIHYLSNQEKSGIWYAWWCWMYT